MQVKTMASIGEAAYSARLWVFPSMPGSEKSGAGEPTARVGCSACANAAKEIQAARKSRYIILKLIAFCPATFLCDGLSWGRCDNVLGA